MCRPQLGPTYQMGLPPLVRKPLRPVAPGSEPGADEKVRLGGASERLRILLGDPCRSQEHYVPSEALALAGFPRISRSRARKPDCTSASSVKGRPPIDPFAEEADAICSN